MIINFIGQLLVQYEMSLMWSFFTIFLSIWKTFWEISNLNTTRRMTLLRPKSLEDIHNLHKKLISADNLHQCYYSTGFTIWSKKRIFLIFFSKWLMCLVVPFNRIKARWQRWREYIIAYHLLKLVISLNH